MNCFAEIFVTWFREIENKGDDVAGDREQSEEHKGLDSNPPAVGDEEAVGRGRRRPGTPQRRRCRRGDVTLLRRLRWLSLGHCCSSTC